MRRYIVIALLAILALPLAMGQITTQRVQPVMLSSPFSRWVELGTITASQAYPAVGDRDYTTVDALAATKVIEWEIDNWGRKAMLTFQTTANADATVVSILGFADERTTNTSGRHVLDDDAIYLGELTLTGGQQTGKHTNVYVDTIASAEDGLYAFSVSDSGNDRRCVAEFQTKGLKRLVIIATTLQGSSTLYAEGRLWQ